MTFFVSIDSNICFPFSVQVLICCCSALSCGIGTGAAGAAAAAPPAIVVSIGFPRNAEAILVVGLLRFPLISKKCRIFEMIINPLISVTSREVSSVRSAAQNTTNQQTAVSSLSGLERFFP